MTTELERLRQLARTPMGRAVGRCFAGPRQGFSYQEAVACATLPHYNCLVQSTRNANLSHL
jgi:hypothetical protein